MITENISVARKEFLTNESNLSILKMLLPYCKITCFGETQISLAKDLVDVIDLLQEKIQLLTDQKT